MSWRILLSVYKLALGAHAYKMQSFQTGLLFVTGDIIVQKYNQKPEDKFDYKRTAKVAIIGILIGPLLHKWYSVLDDFIGKRINFKTVMQKVIADQLFMAPVLVAYMLFSTNMSLDYEQFEELLEDLKHKHSDKLWDNYKIWPFIQMVTFVLPLPFRVPFHQAVAQGLDVYTSYKNKKTDDINEKTEKPTTKQSLTKKV